MAREQKSVKTIFGEAAEIASPEDRVAYLDRTCGDDADLRRKLDALLRALDEVGSFLEASPALDALKTTGPSDDAGGPADDPDRTGAEAVLPPGATGTLLPPRPMSEGPGSMIGPYKLLQKIGEGGMGAVFMAEQHRPVRRRVALKLIKAGMDSLQVIARFEAERQALALMDHPHIARVFDAGTTDSGRPYFVMELVKGIPLTDYCDRHRLGLPERLALFRQICSAVQHAHQKGIIHRDLKPTNVLVESHDGRPVPKVIDFGLAKATNGLALSERSLYSAFGFVAGTPLYMAPEQATLNSLDVDTRADIYALGVILYELLTGSTPIRSETFKTAAFDEMLRLVREVEPPTPSSRISTSEALPSLAANRHIEPARMSRFVRGDLDRIVMKALAKERQRRYDSAAALADDIGRFANHEPVSAGPPTASYRLRKFIRRHRGRVIAASLVLLTLMLGVVGTTLGLFEAVRQRGLAETRLLEAKEQRDRADLRTAEAKDQRAIADARRKEAEKRLAQKNKANAILLSVFNDLSAQGSAFNDRSARGGDRQPLPLAVRLGKRLDAAASELEGEPTDDPFGMASMQDALGRAQLDLGFPEKASVLFAKAHATFKAVRGPDHPASLRSLGNLAASYKDAERLDLALPLYEAAAGIAATLGPVYPDTLIAMNNLALGYTRVKKLDLAASIYEKVLAAQKATLGLDHPSTLNTMNNLAVNYTQANRLDLALALYEEAFALQKASLGPDHPDTLNTMGNLGWGYHQAGKIDRALPILEEILALRKAKLGPDHPSTLNAMNNLGASYMDAGKLDRALPILEEVLALKKTKLGPDHPDTLGGMGNVAQCHRLAGRPDLALPIVEDAASRWKRRTGTDSLEYANALRQVGQMQTESAKWAEAESTLRQCLAIEEARRPDDWATFNIRSMLGGVLLGQKRYDEAEPLLRAGFEGMKSRLDKIPLLRRVRYVEAIDRLIAFAVATNRPDEAKALRGEKAQTPTVGAPAAGTR